MSKTTPEITILTEAGEGIGLGHQSRCQALVDALATHGCNAQLLINEYPNTLALADLIIIDSYKLSLKQYHQYKQLCEILAVIDDYQRLEYPADVIINPALGAQQIDYGKQYQLFTGVEYALLKKEYWDIQKSGKKIKNKIEHILITLGGSIPPTLTHRIESFIKTKMPQVKISTAFGTLNTTQMIQLMQDVDVAVSGGGQTLYELACIGVPTIAVKIAENQQHNLNQWQQTEFIDRAIEPSSDDFLNTMYSYIQNFSFERREKVSQLGRSYVDGLGALRTAAALLETLSND